MKKYLISFVILSFSAAISAFLVFDALAQEANIPGDGAAVGRGQNIQYPIGELGGCKNKEDCKIYCDKIENSKKCLAFAEKNKLMSQGELDMAKRFIDSGSKGPGGCEGEKECKKYCSNINYIDECLAFAEKAGILPEKELAEAKKVQAAIKRGVKPPPCGNKEECDVYCEDSAHMEECINFGIEAGFIQGKELEDSQKMLAAIKRGVKPLPCKGKEACDEFCNTPENMEMCMTFAMEAGFMNEQEKADSQKMMQAIKKGVKPPACKGKEECDMYCQEESHFDECLNFAQAAGFMDAEQAEMSRKTKGRGPGDCKSKEECEAFCNNPDNQETCFNFGKENGMIPEGDLKMMEQGKQQMSESIKRAPPEVANCIKEAVGAEKFEKFTSGAVVPPREIGDQMKICFDKMMGPPNGQMRNCKGENCPQINTEIPCTTPEECNKLCESNPEKCKNFQPGPGAINPGGQTMPQQAGPGGCKSPEECQKFCESNPDQCKNFGSGPTQSGQPGNENGFAPGTFRMSPENITCQNPEECQQFAPGSEGFRFPEGQVPKVEFQPGTGSGEGGFQYPSAGGYIAPQQGVAPDGSMMPRQDGMQPPANMMQIYPEGQMQFMPPQEQMQQQQMYQYQQPPTNIISPPTDGSLIPPSGDIAPPSSSLKNESFLANILRTFLGIEIK